MGELRKPQTIQERYEYLQHLTPFDTKLWGPIMERGAVTLLCGASGAGKTVLMYNLFGALTKGEAFLGLTPPKPLRILQVDNESPDSVQQELLEKFQDCPNWLQLPRDATWAEVEANAAECDVLLIDILSTFSPVQDENDNSAAERQLLPFLFLAKKHNISVVLTYHLGKDDYAADLRGASARRAKTDIMVILYNKAENVREIFLKKTRDGNNGKTLVYKTEGDWIDHEYKVLKALDVIQTKARSLEERLLSLLGKNERSLSRKEIADALDVKRGTAEERMLSRILRSSPNINREEYGVYSRTLTPLANEMMSTLNKINNLTVDILNVMSTKCEILDF